MPTFRLAILLLAAAALLSACGGGGGGNSAGSGTGSRCVGTALFGCLVARQWGLDRIRAEPAWRRISDSSGQLTAPGAGQTVGVIDSGIDQGHPAFCQGTTDCQKTVTEVFLSSATDETGNTFSHGTAVASVIVGRLTEAPGVAWGADVAMFAIPVGSGGNDNYRPVELSELSNDDTEFKGWFDQVLQWPSGTRTLDFVNLSFGYNGIVDMYSMSDIRSNFGNAIGALEQDGATEKTVFVWAAGNAHGDTCDPADFTGNADLCESYDDNGVTKYRVNAKSVEILAGLPVLIPELRGHVIAVVAIDPQGEIASFSNRCGSAAEWCLAAPGQEIRVAYFGPHPDTGDPGVRGISSANGTSFAAPMVTGALVVMKHYFRDQMSNTELVTRLLDTANDSGIYADSTIYGHGLLDLDAATTEVGTAGFALGNTVNGPGAPVAQTRLRLGNAFGNGLALSLAGQEIAAFDALGAPFWYRLGGFARAAPRAPAMARLDSFMAPEPSRPRARRPAGLAGLDPAGVAAAGKATGTTAPPLLGGFAPAQGSANRQGPLRFGLLNAPAAGLGGGHLSLAGKAPAFRAEGPAGFGLTAFSTEGIRGRAPVSGALLSWRPSPNGPGAQAAPALKLTAGWIAERETMLGSRSAGAFGSLSAGSAFIGFDGSTRAGAWRLDASAEVGMAHTAPAGGMLTGVSPLVTSAVAIRAERRLGRNALLRLSVSQPLRVESGRARLSIPVGRTKDRRVLRRSLSADLAPTGRQIDLSARWRTRLDTGGELRLGAAWTLDPGHDAAAPSEVTVLAGLRHSF